MRIICVEFMYNVMHIVVVFVLLWVLACFYLTSSKGYVFESSLRDCSGQESEGISRNRSHLIRWRGKVKINEAWDLDMVSEQDTSFYLLDIKHASIFHSSNLFVPKHMFLISDSFIHRTWDSEICLSQNCSRPSPHDKSVCLSVHK